MQNNFKKLCCLMLKASNKCLSGPKFSSENIVNK